MTYKASTGDARESPAARLAEPMTRMDAEVQAADLHVIEGARHGRVIEYRSEVHALRGQWLDRSTSEQWNAVSIRPD
ncbi:MULTISPECIES: hypothetical protein [unclassified Streptomyces]|uniref:hypothetical protein n=1 Tax=Streptomyces sp. NPDC127532 TaxID=3345399 RepID=UPI00362F00C9